MANWWERKSLQDMNRTEWESICDGCGKCCQIQLQDDAGQRATTNVVCRYMDMKTCSCTEYQERTKLVPTCLRLTPENLDEIDWMPDSCAYRLLRDGQQLPDWHPLRTGDKQSVHTSGASVRDKVIAEHSVTPEELQDFIIQWH